MRNMIEPKSIWSRIYIVGGPGLSHPADCCIYLIDAGKELVMIDCGAGPDLDKILNNVKGLGLDPFRIGHLIATHCHIDHIGGLAKLKEITGCRVVAHQGDSEGIELGDPRLTAANLYGLDYQPVEVDQLLEGEVNSQSIGDLEFHFLHTPGHTPGSIAIHLDLKEGRVLFGQDVHGPFSDNWGSDIVQWRTSMEKLLDLDADLLCEGHAGIFRGEEVRDYIESQLRRYQHL
jgi:glyoxylase-like metal-dependent hydrolase (beta-lactamase superfamily II)